MDGARISSTITGSCSRLARTSSSSDLKSAKISVQSELYDHRGTVAQYDDGIQRHDERRTSSCWP